MVSLVWSNSGRPLGEWGMGRTPRTAHTWSAREKRQRSRRIMHIARKPVTILLADDDPASCRLTKEALQECRVFNELQFVHDGEALLDYLFQRGKFSVPGTAPRPGIIMLDLN